MNTRVNAELSDKSFYGPSFKDNYFDNPQHRLVACDGMKILLQSKKMLTSR
jgi:hypothetical protein